MQKEFNDTGLCVPDRHYMVDTSPKMGTIMSLIDKGKYFTINRPRQFGKTTTMFLLSQYLKQHEDYMVLSISFEGIGDAPFASEETFCPALLDTIAQSLRFVQPERADFFEQEAQQVRNFKELSRWITRYIQTLNKRVVLMIDEVDKSSNNQIFLLFLGLLRQKYLLRNAGQDATFQSVILAGVHDVKTLKLKIRPTPPQSPPDSGGELKGGYNSPWNIAVDFTIDLSFNPEEIGTMLRDYQQDKQIVMDIPTIAEKLYYYTSGYPYLVSKLCKFIDETILPERTDKNWSISDVDAAFRLITRESYTTTLFESLAKNLENYPELYEMVFHIAMNGKTRPFTIDDPVVHLAHLHGILAESDGQCRIHNRIYEQRIYAYMLSRQLRTQEHDMPGVTIPEFFHDHELDVALVLQRFQAFMQEHYSHRDIEFLEREGRLLFLAFLKPIINGKGFEFKEPNVADERRMDVVVTYRAQRYVIELKRWSGPKAHQEGLQQLSDYLDMYALQQGYLLIYDFNKNKTYKQEQITFRDKQIFAVWV